MMTPGTWLPGGPSFHFVPAGYTVDGTGAIRRPELSDRVIRRRLDLTQRQAKRLAKRHRRQAKGRPTLTRAQRVARGRR